MSILDKFPKNRVELPPSYQEIYEEHYLQNRGGKYKTTSLSQKLENWMHHKVAEDTIGSDSKSTLEIGAGTLNHLKFEPENSKYDIIEPFTALYSDAPERIKVHQFYQDIKDVPANKRYKRIISIAVFEHIVNLPKLVAEAAKHLTESGTMRIAIPNEGTIMWRLGTMITGFEFKKKYGLNYQTLMKFEHVNTAKEIEQVLSYFFKKTKCKSFGISKHFAFYRYIECSTINHEHLNEYLKSN